MPVPVFLFLPIHLLNEYINDSFFKKEELLIKALEDNGFPLDDGPIAFDARRAEKMPRRRLNIC